jgi:hypothetical protein
MTWHDLAYTWYDLAYTWHDLAYMSSVGDRSTRDMGDAVYAICWHHICKKKDC